jgi:hypothetical protein
MNVARRRKRILWIYALLALLTGLYGIQALAEEPAPSTETAPSSEAVPPVPSPNLFRQQKKPVQPQEESRSIPFARELSEEDYQWLGRVVWESMQTVVPREQHRGLGKKEIHALVNTMRRNRNEFNLQLDDLMRILSTTQANESAACPEQPKPEGMAFGFDLGRLKAPEH